MTDSDRSDDGLAAALATPAPLAERVRRAWTRRRASIERITREDLVRAYNGFAPIYDWIFGPVSEPGRRRLCAAVNAIAPRRVLEVGVGTGLTLRRYTPALPIVGIDLCERMLERARLRAARLERAVELHCMDAERMEFPDAAFDCVVAPYVFTVTPNPNRLVAELRRVCAPGGTIILLNHFGGSRWWRALDRVFSGVAYRCGFRSEFSFEQHVLGHDWVVESVRDVNLLGLSKMVVIRNASAGRS